MMILGRSPSGFSGLLPLQDAVVLSDVMNDPSFPAPIRPVAAELLAALPWPHLPSASFLRAAWESGLGEKADSYVSSLPAGRATVARESRDGGTLAGIAESLAPSSSRLLVSLLLCNPFLPDRQVAALVRRLLAQGPHLPSPPPDCSVLVARVRTYAGEDLARLARLVGWPEDPVSMLCSPRLRMAVSTLGIGTDGAPVSPEAWERAAQAASRGMTAAARRRALATWAKITGGRPGPSAPRAAGAAEPATPARPSGRPDHELLRAVERACAARPSAAALDVFASRLLSHPPTLLAFLRRHERFPDRFLAAAFRSHVRTGMRPHISPEALLDALGPEGVAGLMLRLRACRVRWPVGEEPPHMSQRGACFLSQGGSDLGWLLSAPDAQLPSRAAARCALFLGDDVLDEVDLPTQLALVIQAFDQDVSVLLMLPRAAVLLRIQRPHMLLSIPPRLAGLDYAALSNATRILRFRFGSGRMPRRAEAERIVSRLERLGPLTNASRWTLSFFAQHRPIMSEVSDKDVTALLRLLRRVSALPDHLEELFSVLLDVMNGSVDPERHPRELLRRVDDLVTQVSGRSGSENLLEVVLRLADRWGGTPEDLLEVAAVLRGS